MSETEFNLVHTNKKSKNDIRLLFIGDIVGRPGRYALKDFLDINKCNYDFVIANVENASHGFGLTKKNHDEIAGYGVDCMTSGNHIWDKKDIYTYIDESNVLIRPYNYHKTARGTGYRIFNDKIIVINLLGKTFMQPVICPFQALEDIMSELKNKFSLEDKIIIVDYHAEATAEKVCFANFAQSLGVKAVLGTHTHVQTSDEKILNDTCAYITDAGFTGSFDSVIGMDYDTSYKRLITSIPERFDVAVSPVRQINGAEILFDFNSGRAYHINRINFIYTNEDKGGVKDNED